MGVGRDGRVIDLHVLIGREGLVITLVGLVITPSHSHRLSLGMPASLTNLGLLAAMVRTNGTLGRDWQPAASTQVNLCGALSTQTHHIVRRVK